MTKDTQTQNVSSEVATNVKGGKAPEAGVTSEPLYTTNPSLDLSSNKAAIAGELGGKTEAEIKAATPKGAIKVVAVNTGFYDTTLRHAGEEFDFYGEDSEVPTWTRRADGKEPNRASGKDTEEFAGATAAAKAGDMKPVSAQEASKVKAAKAGNNGQDFA